MSTNPTTPGDQPSLAQLVQTINATAHQWRSNRDTSKADFDARQRAVDECDKRLKRAIADHKAASDNLRFLTGVKQTLAALIDDITSPAATTLDAWKDPAAALARRNTSVFSWAPLADEVQRTAALDQATNVFYRIQGLVRQVNATEDLSPNEDPNTPAGNAAFRRDLEDARDRKAKAIASLRTALQLSLRTVVGTKLVSLRIEYYQSCLRTAMSKTDDMLPSLIKRASLLENLVESSKAELRKAQGALEQARVRMDSAQLIASVTDNSSALVSQVSRLPGA